MVIQFQESVDGEPISIDDDDSFEFYIAIRKEAADVGKYPIIVTEKSKDLQIITVNSAPHIHNVASESSATHQDSTSLQISCLDIIEYGRLLSKQTLQEEESLQCHDSNNMITDTNQSEIEVGQIYINKETLKRVISSYAITHNFQYKTQKSCQKELYVVCYIMGCNWNLRASRHGKTDLFIIRKFNNLHSCPIEERMDNQRQATSSVIADKIKTKFLDSERTYNPKDIQKDMKTDFGINIHYQKAWRAKEKALESLRGKSSESYSLLPSFMHVVTSTNPGSIACYTTLADNSFQYAYIALYASIQGFKTCRPIIVVDGTFLKGAYKGTLLIATTEDPGGKIFPLSFAVVDSENDNSWLWFFEQLKITFDEREGMCIISDRHSSIEKAAKTVFPNAAHGLCMYHLLNNLKTTFKKHMDKIKDPFFGAARAYTKKAFQFHLNQLQKINSAITEYLDNVGYEKRARAFCPANRFNMMTSNIAESLNSRNKKARELPITTLFIYLHELIQERSASNREQATYTLSKLTERAETTIRDNYQESMKLLVKKSDDNFYKVFNNQTAYIVDFSTRRCTCNKFQMEEIPCAHAIAILKHLHQDCYQYCSYYHKKEVFLEAYKEIVYPLPSQDNWEIPEEIARIQVLPPHGRRQSGRPKKRRFEAKHATKKRHKCGFCKKEGHKRSTCKNIPPPNNNI